MYGKIYLTVSCAKQNFSVGDVYSLSFSVSCGRTIFAEKEYTISIIDYALEYTFYSDTHSVKTSDSKHVDVDCTLYPGIESTKNIVTLTIDHIPESRRYAESLTINYELKEGDDLIAQKNGDELTEDKKFIVVVNTDNLSDGYIELTIAINPDYDFGSTQGDIMNAINRKTYNFSFSVSFSSMFGSDELCSDEYTIYIE